jgi:glycosyltransferase involved in cell wall biosynthesis
MLLLRKSTNMLVSVIIPVYNAEKYIAECLESVLNQTWKDIEIIIVDNNSTDNSLEILNRYKDKYSNCITLLTETKQGPSATRNKGLISAKGRWVQFLDADDLLLVDKIEHQVKLVDVNVVYIAGSSIYFREKSNQENFYPSDEIEKGLFYNHGSGNMCSNLWNKSYLMKINGFDESLKDTEDPDLMFRLFQINENIVVDKIPKTIIRDINPDSLSKIDLKGSYSRHLQLRQRIINYYKATKLEYYKKEESFFLNMMYKYVRLLAIQDLNLGVEAYHKYLPKNFNPQYRKDINTPLWNTIAVRFLGFRKTELWKNKLLNRN